MRKYRIIYLDAFTSEPYCGNPCAVLPQADGLTDEQMQKIAKETNLSETAFVFPSDRAQVRVRYFMPSKEIPFAGHPTIATAFLLAQEGLIPKQEPISTVDFEFNIGVLPVEIHWDSSGHPTKVVMTQKAPEFGKQADIHAVAPCFGLEAGDILKDAPIQVVSTGVPFLIVPVKNLDILKNTQMDRSKLSPLLRKLGVDAAYMFCRGGFDPDTDTHSRLFSPGGTAEDPFTGSAAGCMGAYVFFHGLCSGPVIKAEQGHFLGRPGQGFIEIFGTRDNITKVKVGGQAAKTLDGTIFINEHQSKGWRPGRQNIGWHHFYQ